MPPTTPPSDEEVLAAVRALQAGGSPAHFEVIFKRYYRSLYTFFANRSTLRDEADDLAQTTLQRAYENLHLYRESAPFGAWLRTMGENVWKNAVRKRLAVKRAAPVESLEMSAERGWETGDTGPRTLEVADGAPDPEEVALRHERTRVLQEALAQLPEGMRKMTELRVLADLQYQEIADLTGVGLNTVRSQLFEARRHLRPVLERYFQGAEL
jgi:RNA polymerase sigma-70 factor (ECF subfamily)